MSTPVINAIDNVNQTSLEKVFAAVAADPTARDNLSQSNQNIDKVSTNVGVIEELNANEDAILRMLCRREGFDPANFADLDAVAADVSLVQDLSLREESTDIITNADKAHTAISSNDLATREMMCHPAGLDATNFINVPDVASDNVAMTTIAADAQASRAMAAVPLAMQEVSASQTAMQEVVASQTAMPEVAASQAAMPEVAASQTAMQEVAASQTAMQVVVASQTAMPEVAASQTAMSEVAASQTAMQEVAASQAAMQEVAASQAAMSEVAASQTAMQEVAASQTAMQEVANASTALNEIGNNSIVQDTVYNNNTAVSELNNSNLIESTSTNIPLDQSSTLRNDRVILLSHTPGNRGVRSNDPQFGADNNSFPHTADRIRRNNDSTSFNNFVNHSASFIDIS